MRSTKAKVLHEAGGDTLLNHVLRAALTVAPPERIVVVVGHQAELVQASVTVPGVRFAVQAEQHGTGHALLCARTAISSIEGQLLILNGDGPLIKAETIAELIQMQAAKAEGGCIVTTEPEDATGYGRIVRDATGRIAAIVEQKAANAEQLAIREINAGLYLFDARPFWTHIDEMQPDNAAREYYLTDMVEILTRHGHPISPFKVADHTELLGINTRLELSEADRILRTRKNRELMLSGVTIENPGSVLIDIGVSVEPDTVIEAGAQLRGKTSVGADARIGAGAILKNCRVENRVQILPYVVAQDTTFGEGSFIGPFARLRQQAIVGPDVHIGNFVELKNTTMAAGAKANHLAYLGDAAVGAKTNVGAGTITCNYDGVNKHRTEIGERAFVGSNATLVAPLSIGAGSYIAAGSVITNDVEADALAIARERQTDKPGWARDRRAKLERTAK